MNPEHLTCEYLSFAIGLSHFWLIQCPICVTRCSPCYEQSLCAEVWRETHASIGIGHDRSVAAGPGYSSQTGRLCWFKKGHVSAHQPSARQRVVSMCAGKENITADHGLGSGLNNWFCSLDSFLPFGFLGNVARVWSFGSFYLWASDFVATFICCDNNFLSIRYNVSEVTLRWYPFWLAWRWTWVGSVPRFVQSRSLVLAMDEMDVQKWQLLLQKWRQSKTEWI